MKDISTRLIQIKEKITNKSFRENKGLGNEIGFYIFDYDPEHEILVREHIKTLQKEIKRDYLEEFILTELEKHILNDEAIPVLSKALNERLKTKSNDNHEMLTNLRNKLEKVNKEIENILNAIMSGIVNNVLKNKLDELEKVKLNLELKINELSVESDDVVSVDITEDQIRSMFGKFKDFVLTRNLPECKKFIGDYIKEVIVYKDHIEVVFNVVFSFDDDNIIYDLKAIELRDVLSNR